MISPQLARALNLAGLRWRPTSGDMFMIDQPGFEGDVFTLSDMTIEAHEFETGTVLGFNGTTEWALDSVALETALWLPAEHQLRALLGSTFRSLRRATGDAAVDDLGLAGDTGYEVETVLSGEAKTFAAADPADAYAGALLELIGVSISSIEPDPDSGLGL